MATTIPNTTPHITATTASNVINNNKNKNKRSRTTKHVSFHQNVYVAFHIHVKDFTADEVERTWYSHSEIKEIKHDCAETVRRMSEGSFSAEDENFCTRGLEYRTKTGSQSRQRNKFTSWDAVFLEQDRQWRKGIFDGETLSRAYSTCTAQSSWAAAVLARRDELFVKQHLAQLYVQNTKKQALTRDQRTAAARRMAGSNSTAVTLQPRAA